MRRTDPPDKPHLRKRCLTTCEINASQDAGFSIKRIPIDGMYKIILHICSTLNIAALIAQCGYNPSFKAQIT